MVKSVLSLSNKLPNLKRNDLITKENKNGIKLLYEQAVNHHYHPKTLNNFPMLTIFSTQICTYDYQCGGSCA